MVGNTSWQVIIAAIFGFVGSIMDVMTEIPGIMDTKTGHSVFVIGTAILGFGTAFGLYHAKGKSVTTNPATGQNEKA